MFGWKVVTTRQLETVQRPFRLDSKLSRTGSTGYFAFQTFKFIRLFANGLPFSKHFPWALSREINLTDFHLARQVKNSETLLTVWAAGFMLRTQAAVTSSFRLTGVEFYD